MKHIRIYEILDISELNLIKLSLSKEDIDFRILHENTLQISNAYAMGNSGAILEVLEQDIPLAIEALKEVGVDLESDTTANRFEVLNIADRVIDEIPGLRVLEGNARYFVFFVSLAIIIFLTLISMILKQ